MPRTVAQSPRRFEAETSNFTSHGDRFHVKLVMLCLLRLSQIKDETFELTTELSDAALFNDIIFKRKHNESGKEEVWLIQVKHREGTENKPSKEIAKQELFSLNKKLNPFSLLKYFHSFLKIQRRFQNEYSLLFRKKVEDIVFVIITNAEFKSDGTGWIEEYFKCSKSDGKDLLLNVNKFENQKDTKLYTAKDKLIDDIDDDVPRTSDFKKIVDILLLGLEKKLQMSNATLKAYFFPIFRHILQIEVEEDGKGCFVNFKERFFDANDADENVPNLKIFKEKLSANGFNSSSIIRVPISFKDPKHKLTCVKDPIFENEEKFAEQISKLILIQRAENFSIKIDSATIKNLGGEHSSFVNNFWKLRGHVLVRSSGKICFSIYFIRNGNFTNSLNKFRNFLKLYLTDFDSLSQYSFVVDLKPEYQVDREEIFHEELPSMPNRDDVNAFFEKLKLVVGYPNRKQIDEFIEYEMREKFKIQEARPLMALFQNKVDQWMANRDRTFYTNEKLKNLFDELKGQLKLCKLEGVTAAYLSDDFHYFKRNSPIIYKFLSSENKILYAASKDSHHGRSIIIRSFLELQGRVEESEALENLRKFTRKHGHVFLNLSYLKKNFKDFWPLPSSVRLLVIDCKNNTQLIQTSYNELLDLITAAEKILFISENKEGFGDLLKTSKHGKIMFYDLPKCHKSKVCLKCES